MSQDARLDEEQSTQRRARVLGLNYYDTSVAGDKPLFKELLTNQELYDLKVIPIHVDQSNILFGITTTTSQQAISQLKQRFIEQHLEFSIISDAGYRDYMHLYDPPYLVVYYDIPITQDSYYESIQEIYTMLEQFRADDMLTYLVA